MCRHRGCARSCCELLAGLGVAVDAAGAVGPALRRRVASDTSRTRTSAARVRASILLAGPLAARHGRAVLPPPGGDVIGRRRLDTHFAGLRELGIDGRRRRRVPASSRRDLRGADLLLDEASVTATENILMAAGPGRRGDHGLQRGLRAARADLCALLIKMGARSPGIGTNRGTDRRGRRRWGAPSTRVGPDYVEIGSFARGRRGHRRAR